MSSREISEKIDSLRELIQRHNELYYQKAQAEISDFEYDQLFAELRRLEEEHPELQIEESPTERVGGGLVDSLSQAEHRTPMLSLDNTYSLEELSSWYEKISRQLGHPPKALTVELKIDGLSIALIYENHQLLRAITRGNGQIGDEVTHNVRSIQRLPLMRVDGPPKFQVRGEVYMPRSVFRRLNEERLRQGLPEFANPRNAAAGSLRLLDSREAARRGLGLWCYQLLEPLEVASPRHSEDLRRLISWAFPVCPGYRRCETLEEALALISRWAEAREGFDFDTDGAVIKIDEREEQQLLGATARAPRWAVAYKYPPEGRSTRVLDVQFQIGRTGVVTPVAELEPVRISGSLVSRATLHNFDEVERLDLRIGDEVWVVKSGEVIPKIVGVISSSRPEDTSPLSRPEFCPSCGTKLRRVEDEVALRCPNPECPGILVAALEHFVSRNAMDIEGLGSQKLLQLLNLGLLKDPASLWDLNVRNLENLEGWGEVSAKKLIQSLKEARTRPLDRLLFALGIPMVGARAAKNLALAFGSLGALAGADEASLMAIDGIGPRIAASLSFFFSQEKNRRMLQALGERGVSPIAVGQNSGLGSLEGLTFVLSGSLWKPRPELAEMLEKRGARVSTSVSSRTSYLVAGPGAGSKLGKAEGLGVPVLDEDGLRRILEKGTE